MKCFKVSVLFVVLALSFCSIAQDKNKVLSVKDMHADIDYYYSNLQQIHPNPYLVLSEQEFQNKIDSLKHLIDKPLTKQEFFLHISSFNKYTDLHTNIRGSKKMLKQNANVTYSFPRFDMQGGVVTFYDKDSMICSLVAVNDVSTHQIEDYFFSCKNLVEVSEDYNFYDMLTLYIANHVCSDTLKFAYTTQGKNIQTMKIAPNKAKDDVKGKRTFHLSVDSLQSIAVFEINSFLPKKVKDYIAYTKYVDNVFDTLKQKNINRLYLDLTCNNGGLIAFEEHLLSYLVTDETRKVLWDLVVKQSAKRRSQRGPVPLVADGNYHQQRQYFTARDVKNKFKGEVFVIQSRKSFSAASTLASQLQTYRKSTIIGEECQIKAVYTDPILLTLPKSKFMFMCATGFIKNVGENKTKGVVPDIEYKIYNPYEEISIEQAEMMRQIKN